MRKYKREVVNDSQSKLLKDFTVGDAIEAYMDGFDCICQDGHVSCLTNEASI